MRHSELSSCRMCDAPLRPRNTCGLCPRCYRREYHYAHRKPGRKYNRRTPNEPPDAYAAIREARIPLYQLLAKHGLPLVWPRDY